MKLILDKKFCANNPSKQKMLSNNFSLRTEKHLSANFESSIDHNKGSHGDIGDNDEDDDDDNNNNSSIYTYVYIYEFGM
jgi:hypothetical protein